MSLANLSQAFKAMRFDRDCAQARATLAEEQLREIELFLRLWFCESDEGAREFLRELALDARERDGRSVDTCKARDAA